jgi:hypothetical protein
VPAALCQDPSLASRRRSYDPRLERIALMLSSEVAREELGVPRTTHASWRARGLPALVSLDDARTDEAVVLADARALRAERGIRSRPSRVFVW